MPSGPRYAPERVFPAQCYIPGRGPRPSTPSESEEWDGDEDTLQSSSCYRWGIDLYNHGYHWEAHEAWEDLWKQTAPEAVARFFLQGLIQCAGAALKASMDQPSACGKLAEKGLANLKRVVESSADHYAGVDVRAFAAAFHEFSVAAPGAAAPPQLLLGPPESS